MRNKYLLQKNMISPVLIGGFVEKDRAYNCICPVSVKRSRSDYRAKSVFDDPDKNLNNNQ